MYYYSDCYVLIVLTECYIKFALQVNNKIVVLIFTYILD